MITVPVLPPNATPAISSGCCNEPIVDDRFRGTICSWCTTRYGFTDIIDPAHDDDGPSTLVTVGTLGTTVYVVQVADLA